MWRNFSGVVLTTAGLRGRRLGKTRAGFPVEARRAATWQGALGLEAASPEPRTTSVQRSTPRNTRFPSTPGGGSAVPGGGPRATQSDSDWRPSDPVGQRGPHVDSVPRVQPASSSPHLSLADRPTPRRARLGYQHVLCTQRVDPGDSVARIDRWGIIRRRGSVVQSSPRVCGSQDLGSPLNDWIVVAEC